MDYWSEESTCRARRRVETGAEARNLAKRWVAGGEEEAAAAPVAASGQKSAQSAAGPPASLTSCGRRSIHLSAVTTAIARWLLHGLWMTSYAECQDDSLECQDDSQYLIEVLGMHAGPIR